MADLTDDEIIASCVPAIKGDSNGESGEEDAV